MFFFDCFLFTNFYPPALTSGNGCHDHWFQSVLFLSTRSYERELWHLHMVVFHDYFYPPALTSGNINNSNIYDGAHFYPPALTSGNPRIPLHQSISYFYPPALTSGNLRISHFARRCYFYPPALTSGNDRRSNEEAERNFYPPALTSGNYLAPCGDIAKIFLSTRSYEREQSEVE